MTTKNPLDEILNAYLVNIQTANSTSSHELEVRFGTRKTEKTSIQRQDYDHIIKHLYAAGFKPTDNNLSGTQYLRISDDNIKNLRIELLGKDIIQEYCRNNNLRTCLENPRHSTSVPTNDFPVKVKITTKTNAYKGDAV